MKNVTALSDGSLVRSHGPFVTVRENYKVQHSHIRNTLDLRATLRAGEYAWPGGYPLFLLMSDGETLHFKCAREEYRQVSQSIREKLNDGWRVVACDINYEDSDMYCAHCNERIESAYADDDADTYAEGL